MKWSHALILFIGAPLILAALWCWIRERRPNPVIKAKPQKDSRADFYRDWKVR